MATINPFKSRSLVAPPRLKPDSEPSSPKRRTFETEEQAQREAFAMHLEQFGGFPHLRRPGEWVIVFRHPGTDQMAVVLESGACELLPDW